MEKEKKAMNIGAVLSSSLSFTSVPVLILMLILFFIILIIIALKFKPWRRFLSSSSSYHHHRSRAIFTSKVDDIERPLVSENPSVVEDGSSESNVSYSVEGAGRQTQGGVSLPHSVTVAPKRALSTSPQLMHSDSFVLDIAESLEDSSAGRTLKRPIPANHFVEEQIRGEREDSSYNSIPKDTALQRNRLMLEVIAGPSRGVSYSVESSNASKLPVTIGRVSPSDILLKDSEVSGKHAMINWNVNKLKWELVDIGSLNGTLLNSQIVHHHQSGSRHRGNPVELSSGDIITFGTSSKISVQVVAATGRQIPFGIGIAADAMSMRRGAKKLPMEDVCYYQWPLTGINEFGLFGICDGHGGADAAISASKIMPEVIGEILSDSFRRKKVLMQCDASDVLREAFAQTEERISHCYEGCTATVLLLWTDGRENFYGQCANVGDSACVVNNKGMQIKMTEDHRIVSYSERARFQALGMPLKDGESRICGINLARMIGDKFLKEQDCRFTSEPYISEVVCMNRASDSFALLASDGFWDVVSTKKAVQLVHQTMEGNRLEVDDSAEKIANALLNEARTLRTKDNTSIIFLDFNSNYSCRPDP